jgi:SAM-dependent methyltransferase
MTELPEHVRNRAHWDQLAAQYVAAGEHGWACQEPSWGIWSVPEDVVRMFPDDLAGTDAIELGCGTAYISSWLPRRGARVAAIDNSEQQLATARRLQREHGLPAYPRPRGICPPSGCELRFHYFGIWGLSLGRAAEVGARGSAAAPAGGETALPYQSFPAVAVRTG